MSYPKISESGTISREAAIAACIEPQKHTGERDHAIYNDALRDAQDALRALPPAQEAAPYTGACECIGVGGPDPECGWCGGDGDAPHRNAPAAPEVKVKPSAEEIGQLVYSSMVWAASNGPMPSSAKRWVVGGNSFAQTEARDCAARILAELKDFGQPVVQDHTTAAAPPVKVKPLEWLGTDPDYATSYCCLGSYMTINTYHDRGFMLQVAGSKSAIYLPSLEAAKAAAQADYEARILAALEGGAA